MGCSSNFCYCRCYNSCHSKNLCHHCSHLTSSLLIVLLFKVIDFETVNHHSKACAQLSGVPFLILFHIEGSLYQQIDSVSKLLRKCLECFDQVLG